VIVLAVVLTCVICQQCWYFRNKLIMNNVPRPQQRIVVYMIAMIPIGVLCIFLLSIAFLYLCFMAC